MEVHFEHKAPEDIRQLEAIFRAPLRFGQSSNRLIIAPDDAERVYRNDDANIVAVLARHVLELETIGKRQLSIEERVRSLIGLHIAHRRVRFP